MHSRVPKKQQAKAIAITRREAIERTRIIACSALLFSLLLAGLLAGADLLSGAGRLIGP